MKTPNKDFDPMIIGNSGTGHTARVLADKMNSLENIPAIVSVDRDSNDNSVLGKYTESLTTDIMRTYDDLRYSYDKPKFNSHKHSLTCARNRARRKKRKRNK